MNNLSDSELREIQMLLIDAAVLTKRAAEDYRNEYGNHLSNHYTEKSNEFNKMVDAIREKMFNKTPIPTI